VTRVVTPGETMALLDPEREGELELGDRLTLRFAGAGGGRRGALRPQLPACAVGEPGRRAGRDGAGARARRLVPVRAAERDALGDVATPGVVVRTADGSLVSTGGEVARVAPAPAETVVDEVGAGDAFAAGFAFGLLQGWAPPVAAQAAHVIAGWALRGTGDWETLPRLEDVRDLLPS
jgi:pfkB family carbohydrate kinase